MSVALPERDATAVDQGYLLTVDASLGVHIAPRWEAGFGWDHNVRPHPYYRVYTGTESVAHLGNALVWLGATL